MALGNPKTSGYWRSQGGGFNLSVSFGTSGAATAKVFGNRIYIDVTTALTAEAAAMAVTVPFACRVIDVFTVRNGDAGGAFTLDILNGVGGTSITGGASGGHSGDTDVVRAVELDDAAYDVSAGTVLSFTVGSATMAGTIIIDFIPQ